MSVDNAGQTESNAIPQIAHSDGIEAHQPGLLERQRTYFLKGGILFLSVGLLLLFIGSVISIAVAAVFIIGVGGEMVSEYLYWLSAAPTAVCIFAGAICTFVGIKLLRAAGIATTQVIAPQDFPVLAPAIAAGNDEAITQFIRLSSLSGVTGTFTKIGLTGLPLATILLTLVLALAGLVNQQFLELAKLTLGAFLGSFVQRQSEYAARATPDSSTRK